MVFKFTSIIVIFIHFIANVNQIKNHFIINKIYFVSTINSYYRYGIEWYDMGTKARASEEGTKVQNALGLGTY